MHSHKAVADSRKQKIRGKQHKPNRLDSLWLCEPVAIDVTISQSCRCSDFKMTFETVKVILAATALINIILSEALCAPCKTGTLEEEKSFIYNHIRRS